MVAGSKKAFLLAAGAAMQKYREHLVDQQEIVGALADIVIEIFAMESALLRTQKAAAARALKDNEPAGPESVVMQTAATRVLLQDGLARIETFARTVLAASLEGDMLRAQISVLRRFAKREPADTVVLRRIVADAVISAGHYPYEGR
jgi:butyryl-CoA dehydrogenase